MKAGRELDALIAEKVMGLRGAAVGGWDDPRHLPDGRTLPGLAPRPYSTKIADAKLVWEKMQDMGYCIEMFCYMKAWSVCFIHIDGGEKYYTDWKNSLEAQTCLAALKAVENQ